MVSVQIGEQGRDVFPEMAPHLARKAEIDAARQDTIQALLLFVPLFYACFFTQLRSLGTLPLVIAAGALVYVGLVFARRYMQPILFLFGGLALVYVGLSFLGLLDRRLTLMFLRGAILQQSAYALLLPFAVPAFALYHEGVSHGKKAFITLENAVLIMAIIVKMISVVVPVEDPLSGEVYRDYSGIFQLLNPIALLAFVLVRRTLQSPDITHYGKVLIAVLLLATSSSSQANIVMGILVPLLLIPTAKQTITFCFLIALIGVAVCSWPYAQEIWIADPNTGIRLFFWHDALDRVWESGGLGVGFGTETIRPLYELQATDVSLVDVDNPSFILIGAHNAFVDATYRMGILGFVLLSVFITRLFAKVVRGSINDISVMDCWVVCALTVIMMVNVGLASFNFFFGTAFFIAWLVFRSSTWDIKAIQNARTHAKGMA
jgi:hypothetical protein